jgi:hypothetical protein
MTRKIGSNSEPSYLGGNGLGKHELEEAKNGDGGSVGAKSLNNLIDGVDINAVVGVVRIEKDGPSYRGSTHWDSVLQEV